MAVLPDLPLPPHQVLWDSCVIRVTAIDPDTGDDVTDVIVGEVTFGVTQLSGPPVQTGPYMLVPGPNA